MLANLKDYRPKKLIFKLSDKIREMFPAKLFEGAKNPEEVIKQFNEKFNATFPEKVTAIREMDKFEIEQTREEYCLKQENDVPKRMTELADAIETAKRIKKDAEERYESLMNQIRERAMLPDLELAADQTDELSLLQALLNEREMEFLGEGKRWYDLLRFARKSNYSKYKDLFVEEVLEGNVTNKDQWIRSVLQSNDALYMPIPQSEIDVNPLLKQNPYYTN